MDHKSKREIHELNRITHSIKNAENLESLESLLENEVRPNTMLIKNTDVALKTHLTSPKRVKMTKSGLQGLI